MARSCGADLALKSYWRRKVRDGQWPTEADPKDAWESVVQCLPDEFDLDGLEDECGGMSYSSGRAIMEDRIRVASREVTAIRESIGREKTFTYTQSDRAARNGCLIAVNDGDWHYIRAAYGDVCVYCGGRDRLSMDHVVPVSGGGDHGPWNLVPACRSCNSSKSNHDLEVWCARKRIDIVAVETRIEAGRLRLREMIGDRAMGPQGVPS